MDNLKAGVQTSEFWGTVLAIVVGFGIKVGVVDPAAKDALVQSINSIVGGVVVVVPIVSYILGRSWLKAKTAQAVKNVSTQPSS